MKLARQYPLVLIITLLLLTAIACQATTFQAEETEPDTSAIVSQVVATVEAQRPETAVTESAPPVVETQLAGMSLDLQEALITIYERVNPAVVHIFVFADHEEFNVPLGTGSGFLIDNDGHIVTNNHVVAEGTAFEIAYADGSRSPATLVGTDVDSDLAVIRAERIPDGVQPIPLSNSNSLQVGQFVAAIGNPFGEAGSMSIGIISGLGRTLESQRIAEGGGRYSLPQVIQTDAAINPGNSGGPLLNLNGEVIGVNSAILTRSGTNSGVGFSIPVNAVSRIVPNLIADGEYTYPFMGIRMLTLDLTLQEQFDLPQLEGAYITDVSPGTPAADAGLIGRGDGPGGDLITAIDGQPVETSDDLISYLVFETEVGQTVDLTVIRDGEEISVPLTLGARP